MPRQVRKRCSGWWDLKASEIADRVGWEEERVERLLATYVDQDEIIMGIARRLQSPSGSVE